ncbi:MAG: hypothetical protein ACMVP2_09660 [Imperialibacter sp.]|uniref:hypothetical protein n=1 Tax=Imperialibacter sp. TaxID=2038411 RepID=UPI003A83A222
MKNCIFLLSVLIIFISAGGLWAQSKNAGASSNAVPDFGPAVTSASLTIGSDKHAGYVAQFDFPPKNLKKGWWRYLKTVARVKNRKTYWKLSVPPEKGSSNVPIEMFSEIKVDGNSSRLTLVLNSVNMDASTRKEYMQQTKNFLEEFKSKFYGDYIQQLIVAAEKQARKTSADHQRAVAKREKLIAKLEKSKARSADKDTTFEDEELVAAINTLGQLIAEKAAAVDASQKEIASLKKTLLNYIQKSGH